MCRPKNGLEAAYKCSRLSVVFYMVTGPRKYALVGEGNVWIEAEEVDMWKLSGKITVVVSEIR